MILTHWLLPLIIALPFIGGILSGLLGMMCKKLPRYIALFTMIITLILTLILWSTLNSMPESNSHWLVEFSLPWIPMLNINFQLAVDGLALLMVILTSLLGLIAVGSAWHELDRNTGMFNLSLLWSLGAVMGVFLAIDLFLFFFFWELMLIPIYFMIAIWGSDHDNGQSRRRAALQFLIYTQVAGLILLIGIFALVFVHYQFSDTLSFNYNDLLHTHFSPIAGFLIMLCFFIGFAVKLPILPIQGWLADAHAHAPTAGSVDIAGILIKTAPYGLLRFVLPLFPEASITFAPYAIAIGVITLFYGAWIAFSQTDIKRLLAYSTVSHMGLLLIGLYAFSLISLQGIVILILAQGITASALFILSGMIYERYHTRDLTVLSGLWGSMRYLPAFMMFFSAALLGIPGTGDFLGEIFILFGTFGEWPWITSLISFSMVFAGLYALILIHRTLFGAVSGEKVSDLNGREIVLLLILLIAILWIGLAPQLILHTSEPAMQWIANFYNTAGGLQ